MLRDKQINTQLASLLLFGRPGDRRGGALVQVPSKSSKKSGANSSASFAHSAEAPNSPVAESKRSRGELAKFSCQPAATTVQKRIHSVSLSPSRISGVHCTGPYIGARITLDAEKVIRASLCGADNVKVHPPFRCDRDRRLQRPSNLALELRFVVRWVEVEEAVLVCQDQQTLLREKTGRVPFPRHSKEVDVLAG